MDAYASYTISLTGTEEDIKKATTALAVAFDDESIVGKESITIEETYLYVWVDEIVQLAEQMAKISSSTLHFAISGTVETYSECQDFLIKYSDGCLTVQRSDWYLADDDGHYLLVSDEEEVTVVSLNEPEVIDLSATTVYIEEDALKLSPIPVCRCKCGNKITAEVNDSISILCSGQGLPVSCNKCGKNIKCM